MGQHASKRGSGGFRRGAMAPLVALCVLASTAQSQNGLGQGSSVPGDSTGVLAGTIVDAASGRPVPYGTVLLIGTDRARFADSAGSFMLTRIAPGPYRLRARQIGYSPRDTAITVARGPSTTKVTLRLTRVAFTLAAIKVQGRRSNGCVAPGVPDSATNAVLAAIFAQVRENVDRVGMVLEEYPFHYTREELVILRNDPGGDSTEHADTVTYESRARRPYQVGRVVYDEPGPSGPPQRMMYLPTFRDLADPKFLATHCFSLGGTERLADKSAANVLRVDFKPAATIATPDVEGSVFLDAERFVVRQAVFRLTKPDAVKPPLVGVTVTSTYRELLPLVPVLDATRTVQPLLPTRSLTPGARAVDHTRISEYRLIGYSFVASAPGDQPGLTIAAGLAVPAAGAADPSGAALARAVIEGQVVRTDGTPVQAAIVGLLASSDSTVTSDSGRFVLRNLLPGAHILWVRGAGFEPTRVVAAVSAGHPRTVRIVVAPSTHTLAPITTTAPFPPGYSSVGLDKRIQSGVGNIITLDQIEHQHTESATQLLQNVRGIHLQTYSDPESRVMGSQGSCVSFVLNGIPQKEFTSHDLDNLVSPDQIGAIEIYSSGDAPVAFAGAAGGVATTGSEETLKGEATPSGITLDVFDSTKFDPKHSPKTDPSAAIVPVPSGMSTSCSVVVIWTRARLGIAGSDGPTAKKPMKAVASGAAMTRGSALFPTTGGPVCAPPIPMDTVRLNVYAVLQSTLGPDLDTAWIRYSDRVLDAFRQAFALPSQLVLPVFGYAYPALEPSSLKARGAAVAPLFSTVVVFTLDSTGAVHEARVACDLPVRRRRHQCIGGNGGGQCDSWLPADAGVGRQVGGPFASTCP